MPRKIDGKHAEALAQAIQAEMQFPVQPHLHEESRLVDTLLDEAPTRREVSFQQQGGEATLKFLLRGKIAVDTHELRMFFCLFHNEFAVDAGTDVDHVFAFDKIRERQINLLKFLNSNRKFANTFLDQPGIEELFKRDGNDGRVKGTRYFFKLCYNNVGNLLLMCHACNIRKSTATPLEWFREQKDYFGEKFVRAVEDEGGLQVVIFPRIYRPAADELVLRIAGEDVLLHTGAGQGLGARAMEWFLYNFHQVYQDHTDFYVHNYGRFKEELAEMRSLIMQGDVQGARSRHRTLRRVLVGYNAVCDALIAVEDKRESGTESDDSGEAVRRRRVNKIAISKSNAVLHEIKKIGRFLREYYSAAEAKLLCNK